MSLPDRKGQLSHDELVAIATQICNDLSAAHQKGVLLRTMPVPGLSILMVSGKSNRRDHRTQGEKHETRNSVSHEAAQRDLGSANSDTPDSNT